MTREKAISRCRSLAAKIADVSATTDAERALAGIVLERLVREWGLSEQDYAPIRSVDNTFLLGGRHHWRVCLLDVATMSYFVQPVVDPLTMRAHLFGEPDEVEAALAAYRYLFGFLMAGWSHHEARMRSSRRTSFDMVYRHSGVSGITIVMHQAENYSMGEWMMSAILRIADRLAPIKQERIRANWRTPFALLEDHGGAPPEEIGAVLSEEEDLGDDDSILDDDELIEELEEQELIEEIEANEPDVDVSMPAPPPGGYRICPEAGAYAESLVWPPPPEEDDSHHGDEDAQ